MTQRVWMYSRGQQGYNVLLTWSWFACTIEATSGDTAVLKPSQVKTMGSCWCRAGSLFGLRLAVISTVLDASETCQLLQPCGLTVIEIVTGLLHLQQYGGNMGRGVEPKHAKAHIGDISFCKIGVSVLQLKSVGLHCAVRHCRCPQ